MNKANLIVFISLLLDLLAFTLILPLIPSLIDYYSTHDKTELYHYLNSFVITYQNLIGAPAQFNQVLFGGLLGSWFSFLQFISSPLIGGFSDIYGRRITLLLCLSVTFISYILWLFSSSSFLLFILSRTIGGLSKGNISLSTAIVTDVSSQAERGKAMAMIGISFSIGFIVGPLLGASFSYYSKSTGLLPNEFFIPPALFACVLTFINIIFIFFTFSESLKPSQRVPSLGKKFTQALNYVNPLALFNFNLVQNIDLIGLKQIKKIGLIYFLYLFTYSGLEYNLTFFTQMRFNYQRMHQARIYLFSGLIMILIQSGYVRRISSGKEFKVALSGLLIIIPAFVLMGLSSNMVQFYLSLTLYSYSSSTVVTCLTTVASKIGPLEQKGTVLGIFRSLGSLARAFGPIFSALIYWKFGPSICYIVGAFLLTIPYLYAYLLNKSLEHKLIKD